MGRSTAVHELTNRSGIGLASDGVPASAGESMKRAFSQLPPAEARTPALANLPSYRRALELRNSFPEKSYGSAETISCPLIVLSACQVSVAIKSGTELTLPSSLATLTEPG